MVIAVQALVHIAIQRGIPVISQVVLPTLAPVLALVLTLPPRPRKTRRVGRVASTLGLVTRERKLCILANIAGGIMILATISTRTWSIALDSNWEMEETVG